jgi:alcohol dehydrogenase class IV
VVTVSFEFATAARIVFGLGKVADLPGIAREFGARALVVSGRDGQRSQLVREALSRAGVRVTSFSVAHEPSTDDVQRGADQAYEAGCEVVIGFGGGSVIDAGKAIAALVTNRGLIADYLEVVGRAQPLTQMPRPFIAVPTTAGTGAEVTRNAVLMSPADRVKVSLRSPLLLPRVALVDPELTYDLPPALTATTVLDALTQLLEPYVSCRATPLTDALCLDGLGRIARSLRVAVEKGHDVNARTDMATASLFGGLALANAGLGAVHGFAAPIGGAFPAPHGAVCAALLPHVTETNLRALQQRAPGNVALTRYGEVARVLTGRREAEVFDLVVWLRELVASLGVPPLRAYGLSETDVPALVAAAAKASSMKANPLPLTAPELAGTLSRAI